MSADPVELDPVEERLHALGARTDGIPAPPGLEARILASLERADANANGWEGAWVSARRGLALALCAAFASLALAVWHEDKFVSRIAEVPDAGADLELRGP